jgi:CelD/BcsL family acetyltransferase involved in cellulose biosynthesis
MQLHTIDPLVDRRWDELAVSHPKASVFHCQGWLTALSQTYGYRPLVLTNSSAGEPLRDGIAFCEVRSWLTGRRLVSLPFSDHCEPLLSDTSQLSDFTEWMSAEGDRHHWKYVELRPVCWSESAGSPLTATQSYWAHTLDLTPPLDQIFSQLHKNSIQRRIRRAEREQLSYEAGNSEQLLNDFYSLLLITRRRHQLLPQPRAWFRNLVANMGQSLKIRVARKDGVPVAAILTLHHRNTVVYKYGCSDQRFHQLAGMPFLFWKVIEESKAADSERIDFGRTDMDNAGLTLFKDRFGTTRRSLTYFRYPKATKSASAILSSVPAVRRLFAMLPDALLPWAGRLAYRHIG